MEPTTIEEWHALNRQQMIRGLAETLTGAK